MRYFAKLATPRGNAQIAGHWRSRYRTDDLIHREENAVNQNTIWVGLGWIMMVALLTLAILAASGPILVELGQLAAVLNLG